MNETTDQASEDTARLHAAMAEITTHEMLHEYASSNDPWKRYVAIHRARAEHQNNPENACEQFVDLVVELASDEGMNRQQRRAAGRRGRKVIA